MEYKFGKMEFEQSDVVEAERVILQKVGFRLPKLTLFEISYFKLK